MLESKQETKKRNLRMLSSRTNTSCIVAGVIFVLTQIHLTSLPRNLSTLLQRATSHLELSGEDAACLLISPHCEHWFTSDSRK